jgi:flagella basal body P-ring formation protein FlgA
MRRSQGIALLMLIAAWMPCDAEASITLTLRPEVELNAEVIRVEDLCVEELGPDLQDVILFQAPRAGFDRRITRGDLRRRFVELGIRTVPHLQGSAEVIVRGTGQKVTGEKLASALRSSLMQIPLPKGCFAQRWDLLSLPKVFSSAEHLDLKVREPGPLVGRGTVRIRVAGGSKGHRNYFVSVRRALRIVAMRVDETARAGTDLAAVVATPDTTWVDRLIDWQEFRKYGEKRGGWSLARPLAAGKRVSRSDLRPTVLIHRGQNVEWTVRRGGLEIRSTVRARSDGALGEWILVQSAFENRLRRLCVVGPGRVSATPNVDSNDNTYLPRELTQGAPR